MKVTFWSVGVPFGLAAIQAAMSSPGHGAPLGAAVALITVIWLCAGVPAAIGYWIVRLARRAWRDGTPQASPRPSGWIYPNER